MVLKGMLPAVKNMKNFEKLLKSEHEYIVILETRLSQIGDLVAYAKRANKKVLVHTDLIQGLKADEYGVEYLIRNVQVNGIISTRGAVVSIAKKNKIIAIQRLFALDSHALNHNLKMINKVKPDYIEVLPGVIPAVIQEVSETTNLPVIAGGLIKTKDDVNQALDGGAVAVTTSRMELWEL
ncbi:glycerol-3-phosphate responsive antiterminator [Aquibacillus koreensis]|uniref:Glycerol uptake operon antiterminator regulatory protein n=1 Tax=Aquibacillus koreensis TaxID=279446 RepID=A0A9X4AHC6_9BACI|nr:glycerol-3-phosphate responsive antiterminator [Aquibacillus koreensis]MCT2534815.1 glycerol-3-phosphate responsive antiterminator [Aquibacillus koreensis]MDC3419574.1 glycerol-3-phosphate responsive antiterminator [Aquibacillus koreensis]